MGFQSLSDASDTLSIEGQLLSSAFESLSISIQTLSKAFESLSIAIERLTIASLGQTKALCPVSTAIGTLPNAPCAL